MAVRSEDLSPREAVLYRFPSERLRARRLARRLALLRRRLALGGVAVAVVVGTLFGGGTGVASRPGAPRAVVLHSGETLWDIARRNAPDGVDTRAYVDALIQLNDLGGVPQAGGRLRLPR